MIKSASLIVIIILRLVYQPVCEPHDIKPFKGKTVYTVASSTENPAKLINFSGTLSNKKVVLEWTVGENESVDQFIVEKSSDGLKYQVAALVFGSDKTDIGHYSFYEKAGNQRTMYRIRLISKNYETEFSRVLEIIPGV